MNNAYGGSENRTAELHGLLSTVADVTVWSEFDVHQTLRARLPIRKINGLFGAYPKGGTLVFVGCYFRIGNWLRKFKPGRVIAIYNTPDPDNLAQFLARLRAHGLEASCEFVYASEWLRSRTGLPGVVQMSPIDLDRFNPASPTLSKSGAAFTVGRLSRDVLAKHHPDDPELYRTLASQGVAIKIMGGTVLKEQIGYVPGVDLLPEGAIPSEVFLKSLDCFFYRTSPEWREPHGRVVTEAMAAGLPVVCGGDGGYLEFVEHGTNGFRVEDNRQAQEIFMLLNNDRNLAREIGVAARESMEQMFSTDRMTEIVDYFLKAEAR